MADQEVGEIHVILRPEGLEVSTSYAMPELNLAIDIIKDLIVRGELQLEPL